MTALKEKATRIRDELMKYRNVFTRSRMGFNSDHEGYLLASLAHMNNTSPLLYFLTYFSNTNKATSISSCRHMDPSSDPMPRYYLVFVVIPAWCYVE